MTLKIFDPTPRLNWLATNNKFTCLHSENNILILACVLFFSTVLFFCYLKFMRFQRNSPSKKSPGSESVRNAKNPISDLTRMYNRSRGYLFIFSGRTGCIGANCGPGGKALLCPARRPNTVTQWPGGGLTKPHIIFLAERTCRWSGKICFFSGLYFGYIKNVFRTYNVLLLLLDNGNIKI